MPVHQRRSTSRPEKKHHKSVYEEPVSPMSKVPHALQQSLRTAMETLNPDDLLKKTLNSRWNLLDSGLGGARVWLREDKNQPPAFKAETIIHGEAKDIVNAIQDVSLRGEWDTALLPVYGMRRIEMQDDKSDVVCLNYRLAGSWAWPRYYIAARHHYTEGHVQYLVSTSVTSSQAYDYLAKSPYSIPSFTFSSPVMGNIKVEAFSLLQIDRARFLVRMLHQSTINGLQSMVSGAAVYQAGLERIHCLAGLRAYIECTFPPRLTIDNSPAAGAGAGASASAAPHAASPRRRKAPPSEGSSSGSEYSESGSEYSESGSESGSGSGSESGSDYSDDSGSGSDPDEGTIPPKIRQLLDSKAKLLLDSADDNSGDGWLPVTVSQDVEVSKIDGTASFMQCVRGKTVIPAPPVVVWRYIQDLENRSDWDSMVKNVQPLEKYNSDTSALQIFGNAVWPLTPRTTVAVWHSRVQDGKYIYMGVSVDHPKALDTDAYVRAKLEIIGYVVEGVDNGRKSLVTLVLKIDLGGNIPKFAVKVAQTKYPMVLAAIRKAISELEPGRVYQLSQTVKPPHRASTPPREPSPPPRKEASPPRRRRAASVSSEASRGSRRHTKEPSKEPVKPRSQAPSENGHRHSHRGH